MKRALFCVWMVLALGWCTAWAETDWPPMTAEVAERSLLHRGGGRNPSPALRKEAGRHMGDDLGERRDFAGRGTGVDLHRQFSRRRRMGDEMVYSKGGAAGFRLRQLEAGGRI